MAVPVVQSYTSAATASANSLTLTKPASVATGDLLLILVANADATDTAQWDDVSKKPSGFTLLRELGNAAADCHEAIFWRVADGSEGATVAVSAQKAANQVGYYLRVTGADRNNPIPTIGVNSSAEAANVLVTSVSTSTNNCLIFYLAAYDGADGLPVSVSGSAWTSVVAGSGGSGATGVLATWGTRSRATAGPTGDVRLVAGASVVDGWQAVQFAVQEVQPIVGTLTGTLGTATLVGTGTAPLPGISGSLAQTLGTLYTTQHKAQLPLLMVSYVSNAYGTVGFATITGTLAKTLGSLTLVGAGTHPVTGTLAKTLGALTLSAAGTHPVLGALSQTLGALTLSAAGTHPVTGTLAKTLGTLTVTATGIHNAASGTSAQTLGALTVSAAATNKVSGSLSKTLGSLTVVAAGTHPVLGALSQTLGTLAVSAAGTHPVTGVLSTTLGTLTISAAGGTAKFGVLTQTLGALTLSAAGTHPVLGSLTVTLGGVTLSAAGTHPVTGSLAKTLGDLTSSAMATLAVSGSLTQTLGALTLSAAGTHPVLGALSQTLGNVTLSASGTVVSGFVGSLTKTLDDLTASAAATVSLSGAASITLAALTAVAAGTAAGAAVTVTRRGSFGGYTPYPGQIIRVARVARDRKELRRQLEELFYPQPEPIPGRVEVEQPPQPRTPVVETIRAATPRVRQRPLYVPDARPEMRRRVRRILRETIRRRRRELQEQERIRVARKRRRNQEALALLLLYD